MQEEKFTPSGIPLKRIYTEGDLSDFNKTRDLGHAGEYPFTRGIYPDMYRVLPWVIQVESGFDSAEETRRRVELLQKLGIRHYKVPTFDVYLDIVTQLGHDSDNDAVAYEIGKEGVHLNSINDMRELLSTTDIENTHVAFVAFSAAPMIYSMYLGLAEEQGIPLNKLFASLNNCPLHGALGENFLVFPPRGHLRLMLDLMEFCIQNTPRVQPLTISTYDLREGGATPTQEVALGLAIAIEILEEAKRRGLSLTEVASRMHFHVQAGDYFFEEVAKLRAMRRMWAKLLRERFGIEDPRACRIKYQVHTQGSSLQIKEPLNNIIRTTLPKSTI
jgi:methylmalonyl-CoA mutase N-terminal domain/subunit